MHYLFRAEIRLRCGVDPRIYYFRIVIVFCLSCCWNPTTTTRKCEYRQTPYSGGRWWHRRCCSETWTISTTSWSVASSKFSTAANFFGMWRCCAASGSCRFCLLSNYILRRRQYGSFSRKANYDANLPKTRRHRWLFSASYGRRLWTRGSYCFGFGRSSFGFGRSAACSHSSSDQMAALHVAAKAFATDNPNGCHFH